MAILQILFCMYLDRGDFFIIIIFAAPLWKRILCIVPMLLKRIDTRIVQRTRFQSRAAKTK